MKILRQLGIILAVSFAGEILAEFLPVPGSVAGMILLFLLLLGKLLSPAQVEETGNFFLKNMAFFFIPAGVAIMEHVSLLQKNLLPFLLVCFVSLLVTFAVTAFTVRGVTALQRKLSGKEKKDD